MAEEVTFNPHLIIPVGTQVVTLVEVNGFPSPDSDDDVRGSHVLPVRDVVGLDPGRETVEVSESTRMPGSA